MTERAGFEEAKEHIGDRYERVVLGSKLTSSEREEKRKREEADNEHWLSPAACFEEPGIDFHQVPANESNLQLVLLHEVGHLFGLGDAYPEDGYRSALAIHPEAVMKNPFKVSGLLQKDDIAGLLDAL